MNDQLRVGSHKTSVIEVTEPMLARNIGSGDTNVLATPMLLNFIEMLCKAMIEENLNSGDLTSVGTLANIQHIAPSPEGATIKVKATVIGLDRKKVTFRAEVFDDMEKIGNGIHERVIVNREKFNQKAISKQCVSKAN